MEKVEIKIDSNHDIDNIVKFNLFKYNQENCEYVRNNSSYAHNNHKYLNVGLFDGEKCVGGAIGEICFDWYYLSDFWIDENYRGQGYGIRIIKKIEEIARQNNALGVRIDSWDFQAPEFYKKLGYKEWGRFIDCPPGTIHYYMYKRFEE